MTDQRIARAVALLNEVIGNREGVVCPFCAEDDFDLIGLKAHLRDFCPVFEATITPEEDMLRRKAGRSLDSVEREIAAAEAAEREEGKP